MRRKRLPSKKKDQILGFHVAYSVAAISYDTLLRFLTDFFCLSHPTWPQGINCKPSMDKTRQERKR